MSHSRKGYSEAVRRQTTESFIRCLENAFRYFGGVPKTPVHSPAQHPGIQKIQNLFRDKAARLYHWAKTPAIPADNNRAERELRPLVIARKISFGSQSEQGAQTREILMSVLHTLRKRTHDVLAAFKRALDALAQDETRDPYKLLFDSS